MPGRWQTSFRTIPMQNVAWQLTGAVLGSATLLVEEKSLQPAACSVGKVQEPNRQAALLTAESALVER